MKTLAKISGVFFLILFGWESSIGQANNTNTPQTNVSQSQPNSSGQPSVLGPSSQPSDLAYKPEDKFDRRVVPPATMREADVVWQTRIWRVIDTREKMNQQLYYPETDNANRVSLFSVIKNALISGEIRAYEFNATDFDDYSVPETITEVKATFFNSRQTQTENGNDTVIKEEVLANKVRGYMLKEDWYFEKQRSVIDPRILWICPEIQTINKNTGQADPSLGLTPLFWVNFNELRPLLAKQPVYNEKNDAEWRTFDDIFWKRQFSSTIIMQNNVYNRTIAMYAKGFDALYEGEKIHDKIFDLEHNMWQY